MIMEMSRDFGAPGKTRRSPLPDMPNERKELNCIGSFIPLDNEGQRQPVNINI